MTLLLGIPHRECLMVLSDFFLRRYGFWMITFERQEGSFQNFRLSHWVMVKILESFICISGKYIPHCTAYF